MAGVGKFHCSFLTQKERDTESGLDYFGARYYSSAQGRFTSTDPVIIKANRLFDPQRLNLYAYVRGNPLAFYDPDGKDLRSGTGDQKRIKKALVEVAKRQGGREFLQKLDKLTIQIELNTGDLSGRGGREYGTTAPKDPNKHEFTRQRDAGGNIVDIKGDPVVVILDFNRADKDRETNKAAKELGGPQREGVPASDAQLAGHELGHDEAQFFLLTNTEESVTGRIDTILQGPVDKNLAKDAEKFVDNVLKLNEQKPPEEKKKPN